MKNHTRSPKSRKREEKQAQEKTKIDQRKYRGMNRDEMHCMCVLAHTVYLLMASTCYFELSLSLSFFCQAKRWCVWCNLQINEKQLIIFCSFHFVRSVSNVYFILKTFAAISLHLSTCYGYKVFPETLCRLIQAVNVSTCFLTTILNDDHVSTWSCLIK